MTLAKLPKGWEICLLAATYPDRTVQGSVRLNKVLAYMQREGFPVLVQFRNIQKGPASLDLLDNAELAEKSGFLKIKKVAQDRHDWETRVDFVLTASGMELVRTQVIPAIEKHAKSKAFARAFKQMLSDAKFRPTAELVSEAHETLRLDDHAQLVATYETLLQQIESKYSEISKAPRPRDKFGLLVGATVELARDALKAIGPQIKDPKNNSTGKNHILCKAEEVVELLDKLVQVQDIPRMARTLAEDFDYVLNSLELNAEVYKILKLTSDDELEKALLEVPALDPQQGHE